MSVVINGTTGITTPAVTNNGAYTGDGVSFADGTPSNTLVTDTSGNVGIGAAPTAVSGFSANKLLEMGGASGPALIFRPSGSTAEHTVLGAGDGLVLGATGSATASNNAIRFFTSNTNSSNTPTERMRIDSSGNLLVGTTSTSTATKGYKLILDDTLGAYQLMGATGTGSYAFHQFFRGTNGSLTGVGTIACTGSSTSYNTSSDYRLKENIAPMTGALATVAQLKPVTYKWKVDGSDGQGFIAHELQEVVPDAVVGEKDAVETYVDEDGNEQTRPKYQGIDTSFLVATLTCAIQELKAELDTVKTELATLKGTV